MLCFLVLWILHKDFTGYKLICYAFSLCSANMDGVLPWAIVWALLHVMPCFSPSSLEFLPTVRFPLGLLSFSLMQLLHHLVLGISCRPTRFHALHHSSTSLCSLPFGDRFFYLANYLHFAFCSNLIQLCVRQSHITRTTTRDTLYKQCLCSSIQVRVFIRKLIFKWVNYKINPYHLQYMSMWSLTFLILC